VLSGEREKEERGKRGEREKEKRGKRREESVKEEMQK